MANVPVDDPVGLNIRENPDPRSPVLVSLQNGTNLVNTGGCEVLASGAIWWEVTVDGVTGWANRNFIEGGPAPQ